MLGQRIANYQVVRKLGEGGMGAVFEAVHLSTGGRAAIKVLHADMGQNAEIAARFLQEARTAARVQHPGVVSIYDQGHLQSGEAYLVMEYLKGESLAARLESQGGRLPLDRALRVVRQVAGTLVAAHAEGIVHRDLKPDNLFLVPDPEAQGGERVKLLDFGIAKVTLDPMAGATRTRAGQILGTPAYMAPEQCAGSVSIDDRADVYSLGVVFYQVLSGRLPFPEASAAGVMVQHLTMTPPPLGEVAAALPAELIRLVHAMLFKEPAARPAMAEVAGRLDVIASGVRAASTPVLARRKFGVVGAALGLSIGLAVVCRWLPERMVGRSAADSASAAVRTTPSTIDLPQSVRVDRSTMKALPEESATPLASSAPLPLLPTPVPGAALPEIALPITHPEALKPAARKRAAKGDLLRSQHAAPSPTTKEKVPPAEVLDFEKSSAPGP